MWLRQQIARLGDFNLDAQLTAADIPAMASALMDLGAFEFNSGISAAYVNAIGDINHDGAVTNADFQALLGLVSNSVSPLTAALTDDTGASGSDGVTSDPDISGSVANVNRVTSFRAGFDSAPVSSYSNVIATLQPNGGFAFNRAALEQILGGPLLDGSHTFHLLATDANGASLGTKDVTFTLDTQAPVVPNFNLAPGFAVTTSATTFRSVTLVGSSDPGIMVSTTSSGTLATTTTAADGSFQLSNVVLSVGSNSITLTATDLAGNSFHGHEVNQPHHADHRQSSGARLEHAGAQCHSAVCIDPGIRQPGIGDRVGCHVRRREFRQRRIQLRLRAYYGSRRVRRISRR